MPEPTSDAYQYHRMAGFQANPFSPEPLEATEAGRRALVGRDQSLMDLKSSLHRGRKLITVEGHFGVGKTSLVNCAAWEIYQSSFNSDDFMHFFQCPALFEISPDTVADEFRRDVYLAIAATLVKHQERIDYRNTHKKEFEILRSWLDGNRGKSTTINFSLFGLTIGRSDESQFQKGFEERGIYDHINELLDSFFPGDKGGIVCVLENSELMETSLNVLDMIERLRDSVFVTNGIRWVLTGSEEIFSHVYGSQRLSRHMGDPIEIPALTIPEAIEAFTRRIDLQQNPDRVNELPITSSEFGKLYSKLGRNLGVTFTWADNFCHWSFSQAHDSQLFGGSFEEWYEQKYQEVCEKLVGMSDDEIRILDLIGRNKGIVPDVRLSSDRDAVEHLVRKRLVAKSRVASLRNELGLILTPRAWLLVSTHELFRDQG